MRPRTSPRLRTSPRPRRPETRKGEATDGESSSTAPDEPHPAPVGAWIAGVSLPLGATFPIDPTLIVAGGLALAFTGTLAENALHKFSPSLLLIRVEKILPDSDDKAARLADLENEMQEAELYIGPALLTKYLGLGVAIFAALAMFDEDGIWPSRWGGVVLLFVLTVLLCGTLPDRITDFRAERVVYRSLPVLRVLRILFLPVTYPVGRIAQFVVRNVLGFRAELEQANDREQLADEIRAAVEDSDDTEELADREKEWIENIVDFRKEDAAGIMTPRTDMVGVEASTSFREAVKLAVAAGHSRLPIYDEKMDNITGLFYLRDAVGRMADGNTDILDSPVKDHAREAYFVPESKKVSDLLHEFKTRRVQMAIVVDEYGGTAGVVSIEDILEEIVGDIEDEYDPERESPLNVLEPGRLAEVDAKLRIGDLNEELSIHLPESEDYETVGGFVFSHLGRIPSSGESFQYDTLEFTVLNASERKIGRLRVRVLEAERRGA